VVRPAKPQVAGGLGRLTASNLGLPPELRVEAAAAAVSGEQVLKPVNFCLYKQAYYVKLLIPFLLYNDLCPEEKTNIPVAKETEESSF
jgi:hypothetical protein